MTLELGKSLHVFFAGHLDTRTESIMKPENECGAAWSSWLEFLKELILVKEMRKHFHYGSQYRKEVTEVTREGASSTFLLDISIQQEMSVCMEPFFPIG